MTRKGQILLTLFVFVASMFCNIHFYELGKSDADRWYASHPNPLGPCKPGSYYYDGETHTSFFCVEPNRWSLAPQEQP